MRRRIIETSRRIPASPERVWDVLVDVARWPEWTPTIKSVKRQDEGPLRVGSRAEVRQPKLPKAVWEVTEVDAGRSFTWQTSQPGVTTVARHRVTPDAAGATVELSIEQTGPLGVVAALVSRRITQRYIDVEAKRLAERVTGTPGT